MERVVSPAKTPADELEEAPKKEQKPGPMTSRYLAMPTTRLEAEAVRAGQFDPSIADQTREHEEEIARLEQEVIAMAKARMLTPAL